MNNNQNVTRRYTPRYTAVVEGNNSYLVWDSIADRAVRDERGPILPADAAAALWWAAQLNGLRTVSEIIAGT